MIGFVLTVHMTRLPPDSRMNVDLRGIPVFLSASIRATKATMNPMISLATWNASATSARERCLNPSTISTMKKALEMAIAE